MKTKKILVKINNNNNNNNNNNRQYILGIVDTI